MNSEESNPQRNQERPIVFISYSKFDSSWKRRLLLHLGGLEKAGLIEAWSDEKLDTGGKWQHQLVQMMQSANAAVCLISPNYLNSDFIIKHEVPFLLQRAEKEGLHLMLLMVEPCAWEAHYWLANRQMFLDKGRSVQEDFRGRKIDLPFIALAREIHGLLADRHLEHQALPISPLVANALAELKGHTERAQAQAAAAGEKLPMPSDDRKIRNSLLTESSIDLSRLPTSGMELIGRDDELRYLDRTFDDNICNVLSLVAWGGVGKSTLVNKWCEYLAAGDYRGAKRAYAWSFYSQGTNERVTSADAFIDAALRFFGDPNPQKGSPWARGERLAVLVGREKALLILDGMEPLQDKQQGIKDPALLRLIECLAEKNEGLCIITTREPVRELSDFPETTLQKNLEQLSKQAGRALLRIKRVRGTDAELEAASEAFGNHALAINLLASYLADKEGHHISHANAILDLPNISIEQGKHPSRVMAAFANGFSDGVPLELLCIMGLFDRPADLDSITALRAPPLIPGLTASISGLDEAAWLWHIGYLRSLGLLAPESRHAPKILDCHPLVREHFGTHLRSERPDAWQAGHSRLCDHFINAQRKYLPETLLEMQPLFLAIHHGCRAERHREMLEEIYWPRISRQYDAYPVRILGAPSADLAALSNFFNSLWNDPVEIPVDFKWKNSPNLLNFAGFRLQSLGLLDAAANVFSKHLDYQLQANNPVWTYIALANLSDVNFSLGNIQSGIEYARQAIEQCLPPDEHGRIILGKSRYAGLLHASGDFDGAANIYAEINHDISVKSANEPIYKGKLPPSIRVISEITRNHTEFVLDRGTVDDANKIASRLAEMIEKGDTGTLLDSAFDALTFGRIALSECDWERAKPLINRAIEGARSIGNIVFLGSCLIARATLYRHQARFEDAKYDLREVIRISTREQGKLRLKECDANLEYAQIALAQSEITVSQDYLKRARRLVIETGYHRRDRELRGLERALL